MACGRLLVLMINRHQRKASSRFRGSRRFGGGLRRCHDQAQLFRGAGLSHHSGAAAEAAAGGIGGLLARSEHSGLSAQPSTSFYHADGNGNVTCLVDDRNTVVARYIHDPYGNITASQGSLAEANLYRFSSKEFHPQSELVYYLYRYYEPNLQRWVNRDPIQEDGGFNLHLFVRNDPISYRDHLGLDWKGNAGRGLNALVAAAARAAYKSCPAGHCNDTAGCISCCDKVNATMVIGIVALKTAGEVGCAASTGGWGILLCIGGFEAAGVTALVANSDAYDRCKQSCTAGPGGNPVGSIPPRPPKYHDPR